jgi:ribosomal protein L40E
VCGTSQPSFQVNNSRRKHHQTLLTFSGTIRDSFFTNIAFAVSYGLVAYFYFFTMSSDPGFVPKSASRSASKALIDGLMESRQFDEHHFCVNCMARKPLRSKHCKRCERCVAKSDQ